MRVDRNKADAALVMRIAERLDDTRLRYAFAMAAHDIEAHQIAVRCLTFVTGVNRPFLERLAIDGRDGAAAATCGFAEHTEQAAPFARQALDRLGLVGVAEHIDALEPRHPRQNTVTDAECAFAIGPQRATRREEQDFRLLAFGDVPDGRNRNQLTFIVALDDFEHADGRQLALGFERFAVSNDRAIGSEIDEHRFQLEAIFTLEPERARDLAFADLLGCGAEVVEQLLTRRHPSSGHLPATLRPARRSRLARPAGPIGLVPALLFLRQSLSFG